MKTKILAILLAVCLCVPLVFASCSDGTATVNPIDFFANGATIMPEDAPELGAYESLETEGMFTIVNDYYIVEEVEREEEITVTPEGGTEYTYTKKFTDYNIYKTEDLSKIATYTARTDIGYTDEVRDDKEVVYVDVDFRDLNMMGEGYIVIATRTYDYTYVTKIINDKNEAILSYEGETYETITFYGIPTSPMMPGGPTFHAVLDDILYRFQLDGKEAEVVKDLRLTSVDEQIQMDKYNDKIYMSYYESGKYVFVYDEMIAIYNDKLEAPKFVEFPLEEKEFDQPHNETETEIYNAYKLSNGNFYILYVESKELDCNDCENSCNIFEEEKANYLWLEGTTGYNYKAFVIDIQSAKVTEAKAPTIGVEEISANVNTIIEALLGTKLYKDNVENIVTGVKIVDQAVESSEMVMGIMDNNGNISALAEYPTNVENVIPIGNGQYIAQMGNVRYIIDKDFNIVREFISGGKGTNLTTIINDKVYNVLTGEKVFDVLEEYDLIDTTDNLYIFEKSEEVENEGVTETEYTIVFVGENGETVKSIPLNDNMDFCECGDNYVVIKEDIIVEDDLGINYTDYTKYTVYNEKGETVVAFEADPYNSPNFNSYDDKVFVYYVSDLKGGETVSKDVLLIISEASAAQGE